MMGVKSRKIIVVLIVVMAGTSLFNILFTLHTASELSNKDTESIPQYDFQIQKQQLEIVPSALYWIRPEKASASSVGKLNTVIHRIKYQT